MTQAIAFSLYGTSSRYLIGAVENAKEAKFHYPNWEVHFWVGSDVPMATCIELRMLGAKLWGAQDIISDGMFWRFLIHDVPDVERYIVRDVDSRFSKRETDAVQEWIDAGTQLHVMRDHPWHYAPILGGMWGLLKTKNDFTMKRSILNWIYEHPKERSHGRQIDGKWPSETFLKEVLWESAMSKTVHDSCGSERNWPLNGPGFVGEYIAVDGSHDERHRKIRLEHAK